MAYPPNYDKAVSFTEYAGANPAKPYNPPDHDSELTNIETTLAAVVGLLKSLTRSDGQLANNSIKPEALSTVALQVVTAGWNPRGLWAAGTAYKVGDLVEAAASISFVCAADHVSAETIDTDRGSGRWVCIGNGVSAALNDIVNYATQAVAAKAAAVAAKAAAEKAKSDSESFSQNSAAAAAAAAATAAAANESAEATAADVATARKILEDTAKIGMQGVIDLIVGSADPDLDSIEKLSAAIGGDANFAATVNAAIAARLTQAQGDARYALLSALASYAQLGVAQAWTKGQRGAEALLPATTGTITLDLAQSNNWGGTLTANIVLANPSSMPVGQSGVIRLVNGATPYTIAYGAYWKPVDGATLPALTAVAAACDDLVYYVETATRVLVGRVGGSV